VTAAAAFGDTALTVQALPTALSSGDAATVLGSGPKSIPAGTAMGSKLNIDASGPGKLSPRIVTTNPAVCLLATDAIEDAAEHALSGYGVYVGGPVYENLLPDASGGPPATLAAGIKTELAAAAGVTGFGYFTYQDTTS
jgi:hypothetical protein